LRKSRRQVFGRANEDRAPTAKESANPFNTDHVNYFDLSVSLRPKSREGMEVKEKEKADNKMEEKEFIAGIVRLAHARYSHTYPSLRERVRQLLEVSVKPNAIEHNREDAIHDAIQTPAMQTLFASMEEVVLRPVFEYYCAGGVGKGEAKGKGATMSLKEFMLLLENGGLIDHSMTKREAKMIFVHVNMDDDAEGGGGDATELDYEEWLEVMTRVAWERLGHTVEKEGEKEDAHLFEHMMELFINGQIATMIPQIRN
jgi:hypothetical protein